MSYEPGTLTLARQDRHIASEWEACAALSSGDPTVVATEDFGELLRDHRLLDLQLSTQQRSALGVCEPHGDSELVLRCNLEDRYTPVWSKRPWRLVPIYELGLSPDQIRELRIWDAQYSDTFNSLFHNDPRVATAASTALIDEQSWLNVRGQSLADDISRSSSRTVSFDRISERTVAANLRERE